jgi:hypothetical protein
VLIADLGEGGTARPWLGNPLVFKHRCIQGGARLLCTLQKALYLRKFEQLSLICLHGREASMEELFGQQPE